MDRLLINGCTYFTDNPIKYLPLLCWCVGSSFVRRAGVVAQLRIVQDTHGYLGACTSWNPDGIIVRSGDFA